MIEDGGGQKAVATKTEVDVLKQPWAVGTQAEPDESNAGGPPQKPPVGLEGALVAAPAEWPKDSQKAYNAIIGILASPEQFSPEQIQGLLDFSLTGTTQEEIKEKYPELAQKMAELEELSRKRKNEAINQRVMVAVAPEMGVDNIADLPEQNIDAQDLAADESGNLLKPNPDGSATATTKDGQEVRLNPMAVLAFFAIALLVDGDHTIRIIADQVTDGMSQHVMINWLGISPETAKGFLDNRDFLEKYLFGMDKYRFKQSIEESTRDKTELRNLLTGLPVETRQALISGKEVRKHGASHQLEPELIKKILGQLSQDDLVRLELTSVATQETKN